MNAMKQHSMSVSISTVAALVPILAVVWFIVRPALVASISVAVAEDFIILIDKKIDPMQSAFKVLIRGRIDNLRKDVARMEFRKTNDDTWTSNNAEALEEKKIQLAALTEAYGEL